MLSQTTEYVLRVAVCLAPTRGRLVTVRELSAMTGVPQNYLSKVLMQMAAKGIVSGRRGVGGGYTLDLDPESATVLTVVRLLGDLGEKDSEAEDRKRAPAAFSPLRSVLDEAYDLVLAIYGRNTLADLSRRCAGADVSRAPEVERAGGFTATRA